VRRHNSLHACKFRRRRLRGMSRNKSLICQYTHLFFLKFRPRQGTFGRDMKFGKKRSSIESKSILSAPRSKLSLISAYVRVITVERVGKGTVASRFSWARGGSHGVERGPHSFRGELRDTLEMPGIRYQIFVTHIQGLLPSPFFSPLSPSFLHPLSRPTSRSSASRFAHVFRLYHGV